MTPINYFMAFPWDVPRLTSEHIPKLYLFQRQQTFPLKGWIVNISGLAGHTVHVVATQLCYSSLKAAPSIIHQQTGMAVLQQNFIDKQAVGHGPELADPCHTVLKHPFPAFWFLFSNERP